MRKLLYASLALLPFAQAQEIPFDSAINLLKLPANIHLGEAAGVATNSKGNILVYTRTGEDGTMGVVFSVLYARRLAPLRIRSGGQISA